MNLAMLFYSKTALAIAPYDIDSITTKIAATQTHRQKRMSTKAPAIPTSAYIKAARGEIATGLEKVKGIEAGKGWGVAVFDSPIETLFAALNDEMHHQHDSPIEYTEILSVGSCRDKRKVLMIMPTPIVKDRWWVTENRVNNALKRESNRELREMTWNVVKDVDELIKGTEGEKRIADGLQITFSSGAWLLIKLDENHTLGEYFTWADPGGVIPAGPASIFVAGQISNFFKTIDHYVKNAETLPCMGKMR